MTSIVFVGVGELACALGAGMSASADVELLGYSRPRADRAAAQAQRDRADAAGIRMCETLAEAVGASATVVAAVPMEGAADVAHAAAAHLRPGSVYVDTAPLHPDAKFALAQMFGQRDIAYVDAAVLGTVAADGAGVRIVAAGPGAERWSRLANELGLNVTVLGGPPGQGARLKLLRSVYMKGRDALVMEMLLAARQHGFERELLESIDVPGERVPFPAIADRIVCAMAVHAGRRADELALSAELVRDSGVEPLLSEAGARRLRGLAELGLREQFGGERPTDSDTVLAAIERRRA
jgi:3-hydroxyisobutyrate dehydrogenase-like beta-hydroxyacid dehydrogenase